MSQPPEMDDALQQLRAFWQQRASQPVSDSARVVDFNPRTQRMRFQLFLMNHPVNHRSILDVGCGLGDFLAHLQELGVDCNYVGVDLADEMIARCRQRFPETPFEVRNILDDEPEPRFDYVVSFGIHNIKVPCGEKLLESLTRRQFDLCRVAAHISILTDRYGGFDPHIMAWHAEDVLAMALNITPYVALRHDYLPHDFSVTLYRQPLIDTGKDLKID